MSARPVSVVPELSGPAAPAPSAVVSVADLHIRTPDRRVLLERGGFELHPGEVVLLLGPSGGGKTSIARLLSGLLPLGASDWSVRGTLLAHGRRYDLSRERPDLAGLVFQSNALFDDLNAGDNIAIAVDHAERPLDAALGALIEALLEGIDLRQPVSALSGGQRQRVAIARTVAAQRSLLILDEPNSGLDPLATRRLVALLRTLSSGLRVPILVVAHHYLDLLELADRVLVLDQASRTLHTLPACAAAIEARWLAGVAPSADGCGIELPADGTDAAGKPDTAVPLSAAQASPLRTVVAVEVADPAVASGWASRRSGLHWLGVFTLRAFGALIAAPSVIAYTLGGAAIMGFVTMWFGFNYDVLGPHMRSFVHDDALTGIGFITLNTTVPLIVSILLVARNNAAVSAHIAGMHQAGQLAAMRNLRIPGLRYHIIATLLGMGVGAVLLVCLALLVASWAALQGWQVLFPGQPVELWQQHFARAFLVERATLQETAVWVLLKSVLSAVLATAVALRLGVGEQRSLADINTTITRAIVLGVLITLCIHAGLTVWQL
jgi:ABC-type transporter Mla maintaining outer membrane lipid asymmetry ATPase subunit MlaF/ABC-type transporter Mla maintaining outer membrane lipid asymmetry permease subunit MlaE